MLISLGLFMIAALAYGVAIPWMGLYGDDLPYMWIYHVFGSGGYPDFVAWDRPMSAWIYMLITPLFGEIVWPYHVLMLFLRWFCAVIFWRVLEKIWPDKKWFSTAAALIFLTYPGFQQQYIPFEFMVHFCILALFFISLRLMVQSVQPGQRNFWLLNLAGAVGSAGMFSMEYFVGLDLLRPVILWVVLTRLGYHGRVLIKKVGVTWLPYLLVWMGFVYWRIAIFKFTHYQPRFLNELSDLGGKAIVNLAVRVAQDIKTTTYGAWRQIVSFPNDMQTLGIFVLLVMMSGLLAWWIGSKVISPNREEDRRMLEVICVGILSLILAGMPMWLPQLPVESTFPWDRSSLAFMPGASMVLAGMIYWTLKPRFQPAALAIIVALSVGFHMQNARIYQAEWSRLQSLFWQLTYRAPGLKPGAILISGGIPLYRYSDTNLTAFVNWTYAPDHRSKTVPYFLYDLDSRKNAGLPSLNKNIPVKDNYRSIIFESSTSNVVVFTYQPPACLHILSPEDLHVPFLPTGLEKIIPLANLDMIVPQQGYPAKPPHMMTYPEEGWCSYFQRAELSNQQKKWISTVQLDQAVDRENLIPAVSIEWLPFFLGNAQTGNWERAEKLAGNILKDEFNTPEYCSDWNNLGKEVKSNAKNNSAKLAEYSSLCQ